MFFIEPLSYRYISFFINLDLSPKSNENVQLSSLLHTRVKIEEPYKPK